MFALFQLSRQCYSEITQCIQLKREFTQHCRSHADSKEELLKSFRELRGSSPLFTVHLGITSQQRCCSWKELSAVPTAQSLKGRSWNLQHIEKIIKKIRQQNGPHLKLYVFKILWGSENGEEGICCCFCCLGTVLLVLCFTVLHNKHKMQLLCKRKCGKSLGHLNTSWLDMHWHVLVVLCFPHLPRKRDTQHCQESLDRDGATQRYLGSPLGGFCSRSKCEDKYLTDYFLPSPCSLSGMGRNIFNWTHAIQGVKIRAGPDMLEF